MTVIVKKPGKRVSTEEVDDMNRLYRGRYRICFYDEEEQLVMVFDNVTELVLVIEHSSDPKLISSWRKKIVNAIHSNNKIVINGIKYTPRKILDV